MNGSQVEKKELLVIEYLNAQSLLCHYNVIESMLHERDIDILCVCETWLNSSVNDKFINIPNFKIIRYDTGRGGGSCIFVRDHLSVTLLSPDVDRMEGVDDV